jgi:hypothetical protein
MLFGPETGYLWQLVIPVITLGIIIPSYFYFKKQKQIAPAEEEEEFFG